MKNQRTLLIEQAARDDADEGTEWRERMDRWLGNEQALRLCRQVGATWVSSSLWELLKKDIYQ